MNNLGILDIGDQTICNAALYTVRPDAVIRIGDRCWIGRGEMWAAEGIIIASDALIGNDVLIMDTDMHSVEWEHRRLDSQLSREGRESEKDWGYVRTIPVVIHARVWLGARVIVLPGTDIGTGAVIAAGSVVHGKIPPYQVWGGNPAVFLKGIPHE